MGRLISFASTISTRAAKCASAAPACPVIGRLNGLCSLLERHGRSERTHSHTADLAMTCRAHTALVWGRENQYGTQSAPRACLCNHQPPANAWRPGSENTAQSLQRLGAVPGAPSILLYCTQYQFRRGPSYIALLLDARAPNKQWHPASSRPPPPLLPRLPCKNDVLSYALLTHRKPGSEGEKKGKPLSGLLAPRR